MSKYCIIIIINYLQLFHLLAFALEHKQCSKNSTEICIPSDYDKNIIPKLNEANSIIVNFGHLEILQVDDRKCTINLNFNLFLAWFESRGLNSPASLMNPPWINGSVNFWIKFSIIFPNFFFAIF